MEMFLAVHVQPIDPQVGRAVGGEGQRDILRGSSLDLGVCPGSQIVAGVVERRNVDKVIVQAAEGAPGQLAVPDLERLFFHRKREDLGQLSIVVLSDLQFKILAGKAVEILDRGSVRPGHEPVVNEPAVKLIFQVLLCHLGKVLP